MVVLPAPVEGAMEAEEGGARQPGRLPKRLMESSDAEDAELGLPLSCPTQIRKKA